MYVYVCIYVRTYVRMYVCMYVLYVCTVMWLSCVFCFIAADVTIPMTTTTPSTSTSTPKPLLGIVFHAHMYVHTVQRCNMQFLTVSTTIFLYKVFSELISIVAHVPAHINCPICSKVTVKIGICRCMCLLVCLYLNVYSNMYASIHVCTHTVHIVYVHTFVPPVLFQPLEATVAMGNNYTVICRSNQEAVLQLAYNKGPVLASSSGMSVTYTLVDVQEENPGVIYCIGMVDEMSITTEFHLTVCKLYGCVVWTCTITYMSTSNSY